MLPDYHYEQIYQIALSFVPHIGPRRGRALLSHFKSAGAVFQAPLRDISRVDGMTENLASGFRDKELLTLAEQEFRFCQEQGISLLFMTDTGFPKRFLTCEDAPLLLFYKGNADLNAEKVVAIIGTRKNSDYGQRATEDLVRQLEGTPGLLVTSGLALGIDTIAHRNCVRNRIPTVGVLGHSLDRIYPFSNRELAAEMLEQGGLLSEFPSGTRPERTNFPVRNRVVAGMSDVTVIVESDIKGGAMITAYLAHSYGRDVAAFPGRIYDTRSGGPNLLIKRNVAALIQDGSDLLELMNWDRQPKKAVQQQQLFPDLLPEERQILDILTERDSVHTDDLMLQAGMNSSQLASVLLQMEMKDLVKALPGKCYRLN